EQTIWAGVSFQHRSSPVGTTPDGRVDFHPQRSYARPDSGVSIDFRYINRVLAAHAEGFRLHGRARHCAQSAMERGRRKLRVRHSKKSEAAASLYGDFGAARRFKFRLSDIDLPITPGTKGRLLPGAGEGDAATWLVGHARTGKQWSGGTIRAQL